MILPLYHFWCQVNFSLTNGQSEVISLGDFISNFFPVKIKQKHGLIKQNSGLTYIQTPV